jgi:hypothetical protein
MGKCISCKSKVELKVWNGIGIVVNGRSLIPASSMTTDEENCSCSNPMSEFYNSGISRNNSCNLYEYDITPGKKLVNDDGFDRCPDCCTIIDNYHYKFCPECGIKIES